MECVCEADEQKFKFVGSSLGVTGHHRLYKQVELEEPTARISIGSIVLVRYEPGREEKQNNALPLTRALCTVRAIWFCTRNKAAMIAVDFFWRFTDISDSSVLSSLQAIGAKYSDMCESHATNVEECDKMAVSCVLGVCTKVQSRILLPATTTTIHVCGRINDPTRAKPAVQTSKLCMWQARLFFTCTILHTTSHVLWTSVGSGVLQLRALSFAIACWGCFATCAQPHMVSAALLTCHLVVAVIGMCYSSDRYVLGGACK
eukprot:m.140072 g.140072  ORF g.140072 m.140072 type:complete len:260 (+) comp14030_c1_seq3:216-995(+)